MNPIVFILSALDLLAGILVFISYSGITTFIGKMIFYVSVFHVIKGAWSIFTSFMMGYTFDLLGWIDLISGIIILLGLYGIGLQMGNIIGLLMIIKGLYCLLFSF